MRVPFAFVCILLSIAARRGSAQSFPSAYAVAFFDDSQSSAIVVNRDGTFFLDIVVFVRSSTTSQDTTVAVNTFAYGDIASSGGLVASSRRQLAFIPSVLCPTLPCTASYTTELADWCNYIGRAFTIDSTVDGATTTMTAVLGIADPQTSTSCSFAASFSTQPTPAIAKLQAVGSSGVTGTIVLQLRDKALTVSGFVAGLPPSSTFGVHVHQYAPAPNINTDFMY